MTKIILAVLGRDRPGIVAAVTGILFEQNGNIENVSQTILQTEFAGIFIVSIPGDVSLEVLHEALNARLKPMGLHAHIEPVSTEPAANAPTDPTEPFVITTKGPDRKGLVAGISAVIARYGVNITNLQAVFKGGDDPGANIMIYEVDVPVTVDRQSLNRDLREKARSLALDISIQHRNIFKAINRI